MSFDDTFFSNCRKPRSDVWGRLMLSRMNVRHNDMSLWCMDSCMALDGTEDVLDIGCGGGRNIENLLARTSGVVYGADYAAQSVATSLRRNRRAVAEGRTKVVEASVSHLPFDAGRFDVVTAFETVYFWPNIAEDFCEVRRVLRARGRFVVCNELSHPDGNEKWIKLLDMNIFTPEEIVRYMKDVGFAQATVFSRDQHVCVVGTNCP